MKLITYDVSTGARTLGPALGWPRGSHWWDPLQNGILGSTRSGEILVLAGKTTREYLGLRYVALFSLQSDGQTAGLKQWTVDLDDDERAASVALSPKGDELAWLVVGLHRLTPSERWLNRLLRRSPERSLECTLRLTGIDGTHSRTVCTEPLDVKNPDWITFRPDSSRVPMMLRWLPDGKHVSYEYWGALRRICVE